MIRVGLNTLCEPIVRGPVIGLLVMMLACVHPLVVTGQMNVQTATAERFVKTV
jgi:hypothetical protein